MRGELAAPGSVKPGVLRRTGNGNNVGSRHGEDSSWNRRVGMAIGWGAHARPGVRSSRSLVQVRIRAEHRGWDEIPDRGGEVRRPGPVPNARAGGAGS